MSNRLAIVPAALLVAAMLGGCAGPVLTVRHDLPAAVPLPPGVARLEAGDFGVTPPELAAMGEFVACRLGERFKALWPDAGGKALRVGGTIVLKTRDDAGSREVRVYDAKAAKWVTAVLPTLTRTASADVNFAVADGSVRVFGVDARQEYTSAADPRVRGETGLERPDDPARMPPADTAFKEMLEACAEEFVGMVQPLSLTVRLETRGTLNGAGSAGLKAAKAGDYAEAQRLCREAATGDPKSADLHFNLAAVSEAAGDLSTARAEYEAAAKLKPEDDAAKEGAVRAARLMERIAGEQARVNVTGR
jgi:hypothetical protein